MHVFHQQQDGHTCLLCGTKDLLSSIECRNCGGILKIVLVAAALAALVYYVI